MTAEFALYNAKNTYSDSFYQSPLFLFSVALTVVYFFENWLESSPSPTQSPETDPLHLTDKSVLPVEKSSISLLQEKECLASYENALAMTFPSDVRVCSIIERTLFPCSDLFKLYFSSKNCSQYQICAL